MKRKGTYTRRYSQDTEPLQQDFPQSFLVRRIRGQARAMVSALQGWREPRVWHFPMGVCVIDNSLSDALFRAERIVAKK